MQNANSSSGPCNIVLFLWKGHQSTFSYGSRQFNYGLVFLKSRHSIIIHATSLWILWKIDSCSNHCVLDLKASSIKLDMALQPKIVFKKQYFDFYADDQTFVKIFIRSALSNKAMWQKIMSSCRMNKTKTFRFKRQFPSRIIKI